MAYTPAFLIFLLLLLFWYYTHLYPVISPVSILSFLLLLSHHFSRLYHIDSCISILSFQWSSLAVSSNPFSPLTDQIYHSQSIMSVYTRLLSHMPRSWVSLITSSLAWHLPQMTMVVSWSSSYHIGVDNYFYCSFFAFCIFISSLNYGWPRLTFRVSFLHSTNIWLLISMMLWACCINLDNISIFYNPFLFLISCVTGNMATHHWIFPSHWRCAYDCCWGYPHPQWCSNYDLATSQTCW